MAEKMPSSVSVGSRPMRSRMRWYSSGFSPWSATSSGVIAVSGEGMVQGRVQRVAWLRGAQPSARPPLRAWKAPARRSPQREAARRPHRNEKPRRSLAGVRGKISKLRRISLPPIMPPPKRSEPLSETVWNERSAIVGREPVYVEIVEIAVQVHEQIFHADAEIARDQNLRAAAERIAPHPLVVAAAHGARHGRAGALGIIRRSRRGRPRRRRQAVRGSPSPAEPNTKSLSSSV